jgi:hypothetical protein
MNKKTVPSNWLYFLIFVMGGYFVARLVNQAQMVKHFPLDFVNDYSSHIAELFFLKVCGFHGFCPFWYNGFDLFISYVPGWFFYAYPFYWGLGDPLAATFLALVVMFVLVLLAMALLGKELKLTRAQVVAFFLLLFANPISIGNFIRLGRLTEITGWFSFFLLAFIIYRYKDRKLDYGFLLFIPFYAYVMISHLAVMLITQVLVLSLFLVKPVREKVAVVLAAIGGLSLSSFWVIPYLQDLSTNTTLGYAFGQWLLDFGMDQLFTNIATFAIGIFLWAMFYLFWKQNNYSKKELLFYLPILVLSVLTTFRISPFLPIVKHLYPDPLMVFYLIFGFIFLFKLDLSQMSRRFNILLKVSLVVIPIVFVVFSSLHTSWFEVPGDVEHEVLDMLPFVEGTFVMSPSPYQSLYGRAVYSYAPIYHGLSTADGWAGIYMTPEYKSVMDENVQAFKRGDCDSLKITFEYLAVDQVVGLDQYCPLLESCGYEELRNTGHVCLVQIS